MRYQEYKDSIVGPVDRLMRVLHKRETNALLTKDARLSDTLAEEARECLEKILSLQEELRMAELSKEDIIELTKAVLGAMTQKGRTH